MDPKLQLVALVQAYSGVGIGLIIGVGLALWFAVANPLLAAIK